MVSSNIQTPNSSGDGSIGFATRHRTLSLPTAGATSNNWNVYMNTATQLSTNGVDANSHVIDSVDAASGTFVRTTGPTGAATHHETLAINNPIAGFQFRDGATGVATSDGGTTNVRRSIFLKVPGVGISVNGARRWIGAGPVQFQPSELLKVALVLYAAQVLATQPKRMRSMKTLAKPLLLVIGAACLLLLKEPDMGTAIVVCLAMGALFIAAGVPTRHLLTITGTLILLALVFAIAAPYRRARLMSFVHPWHDASGAGFQTVQSMIAIGSGGFFGVGLGESVQKIFYLPEAHTDMILAIIGEELGIFGVTAVAALYGMIAYGGLRAAKLARERYAKLLAVGVTSVVLCQAILNFFAVLGLAPLTGVPLPFISYGNSNLVVLLGAMGLLLNVAKDGAQARAGKPLRAIEGGKGSRAASADSRGRNGGTRRAGARGRGRAAG